MPSVEVTIIINPLKLLQLWKNLLSQLKTRTLVVIALRRSYNYY
nr:MAG TPA: hypothetical protein [Microviridae sp.]